jgi:hypothetical protein
VSASVGWTDMDDGCSSYLEHAQYCG